MSSETIPFSRRKVGAVAFYPDGGLIAFSVWGRGRQVWAVKR